MKICGVVAEYNPFHRGHAFQFRQIRRLLGSDTAIVCCMSGDYVQRGEPAVMSKWARAESAVRCGADLVVELPSPWALQSAEGFARASVGLLAALGCATDLAFGAECPNVDRLQRLAALLLEHETAAATLLELRQGIPYAAARERALYKQVQQEAALLRQPNNILAVEYCKALQTLGGGIRPHALARRGPDHDRQGEEEGFCSASQLRSLLAEGKLNEALALLPPESRRVLAREAAAGRAPALASRGDRGAMARLWRLSPAELADLPGASEGLENRLYQAVQQSHTVMEVCDRAKTKRYAHSRLRRMVLCAYLGVSAEESAGLPPYLNLLAFSQRGRAVLSQCRKTASLPLITKPAHSRKLGPEAQAVFAREALRSRLHSLYFPDSAAVPHDAQWTARPFYLPSQEETR